MDMEPTVAKPGIGDSGWGATLNAHLDGIAEDIATKVNATTVSSTYARKRERDPRDFGLSGGADDSIALQACIDDAGAGGTIVLPDDLTINYRSALVLPSGTGGLHGVEFRGSGNKGSVLASDVDVACLTGISGHGLAIRNLVINNSATTRTTFDIDLVNPTKPVIEDVEIECIGMPTGGGGGLRLRKDAGESGNAFMPQLSRVWIRQGSLVIDGVTDGHFTDGFVWAADTAAAAIHLNNISDGWTFTGVDVVPSDAGGAGYLIELTNHIKIVGGYCDGSYVGNLTGHGIVANSAGRLFISGFNFYHCGRSGLQLNNTNGCVVTAAGFYRNNKQDNSYPDIDLVNSDYNTFIGLSHSQPTDRTNKGAIYREDAASVGNLYDASVLETTAGSFYASPLISANTGTVGKRNRPASSFPRPAGVAEQIIPPGSLIGLPAATGWAAANTAIFQRFTITEGGVYRYANFRVGTGSGNMQAAVVRLSGAGYINYDRVLDSGVVACTAGNKTLDMTSAYLAAGEYALALWFDNTTATVSRTTDSAVQAMRLSSSVAGLATGIPSSGTLGAWGSTGNYIGGLTLSQTTT